MSSFVVRHLPEELGDVTSIYKSVKKTPFSYTSKKHEAEKAATGKYIYVIEREKSGKNIIYKLAYRYKCSACFKPAGTNKWLEKFDFKNTVEYGSEADLQLLESPKIITNPDFNSWYKTKTLGMCELPAEQEAILNSLLV
ncbi:hypothetical protein [Shewanella sp. TB7-MNA-CIBAN-0143]|jgi:hypothetical protein|uniref:hypothetical protein n=1 Tax=unclassified Shewanella TaxID=196818 RepID=UPI00331B6BCC